MVESIAPLRNVRLFKALLDALLSAPPSHHRLGCWYGPSGFGKSTAAAYGAQKTRAYFVQCGASWSPRTLCDRIMVEIGLPPKPGATIADKVERVIDQLLRYGRPLIVDEFDFMVQRRSIEIVREIHDYAQVPIILIGEEALPDKLRAWERFHNRVLLWQPAEPLDIPDYAALAASHCPGVTLDPALITELLRLCGGRARRAVQHLYQLRERAARDGVNHFTPEALTKLALATGAPPIRRFTDAV